MQFSVQTYVKLAIAIILTAGFSTQAVRADVIVTQLANEGFILSDGESASVMIDGMVVEPYSVYGGLSEEVSTLYFQAAGPFSGIDLALASHQHHDHNQPDPACKFMQKSTGTLFVSSAQVMDLMREKCRQLTTTSPRIRIIDPQYGQPEVIQVDGITVTAFLLTHGGGKYSVLQNFGHLIEIGGMRVLHVGDADMEDADFARAGVDQMNIDVALVPFWYFQPGPGGEILKRYLNVPHLIATHIPPGEMEEILAYMQVEYPAVVVMEKPLVEARFNLPDPVLP